MAIGKELAEVEHQLQLVLGTLNNFEKASVKFEQGRRTLEGTAKKVNGLIHQARESLDPALAAVASLQRLDPDHLLAQVTEAAKAVRESLNDVLAAAERSADYARETRGVAARLSSESKQLSEALKTLAEQSEAGFSRVNQVVSSN